MQNWTWANLVDGLRLTGLSEADARELVEANVVTDENDPRESVLGMDRDIGDGIGDLL